MKGERAAAHGRGDVREHWSWACQDCAKTRALLLLNVGASWMFTTTTSRSGQRED